MEDKRICGTTIAAKDGFFYTHMHFLVSMLETEQRGRNYAPICGSILAVLTGTIPPVGYERLARPVLYVWEFFETIAVSSAW